MLKLISVILLSPVDWIRSGKGGKLRKLIILVSCFLDYGKIAGIRAKSGKILLLLFCYSSWGFCLRRVINFGENCFWIKAKYWDKFFRWKFRQVIELCVYSCKVLSHKNKIWYCFLEIFSTIIYNYQLVLGKSEYFNFSENIRERDS